MAQTRSRRLRKKLHIDEFQELGFTVEFSFKDGTDMQDVDKMVDLFIEQAIEPNGLAFGGSGNLNWQGLICLQKIGKCAEEHRTLVSSWLEQHGLINVKTSELFDIWWS